MQKIAQDGEIVTLEGSHRRALARSGTAPVQKIAKRSLDLLIGSLAILILAPVFVLIAACIKLTSPGSIFFRQRRGGINGDVFRIWKFRTMYTSDDGDMVAQAQRSDSRLIPIGGFLRRFNLDELPQLFNVIAGDMSLVGPRPHALAHDVVFEKITRRYAERQRVKPGITGWAQVNGCRGIIDTESALRERVEKDIYYIEHCSILFDLYILARTFSLSALRNAL